MRPDLLLPIFIVFRSKIDVQFSKPPPVRPAHTNDTRPKLIDHQHRIRARCEGGYYS